MTIIKCKKIELLTDEFMKKMIKILETLILWILEVKRGEDQNIVELEGVPQEDKQRLCKDMKLIELLTDLLYYPTGPSGICALSDIAKQPNLLKMHQLCYRLIKHSIREYRPSEIYASQWINMFMAHTLETKKMKGS